MIIVLLGLIFTISFMENSKSSTLTTSGDLTPSQFNQALSSGKYELIDVRTADEYNAGHLKNAKQSDFYQTKKFISFLETLDKTGRYLIYCRTGVRSGQALKLMQKIGFKIVYDLAGGYNAWISSNLPVEQ